MRKSQFHERQNAEETGRTFTNRNRESRWDPTIYKPSEFYGQLAQLFAKLRQGLGSQLDRYLGLLKQFSKQSLSTYELTSAVEKLLPSDLLAVHEEFVGVFSESCQLSAISRSVEEVLMGKKSRELKKGYVPHISSINALLILRSLENGWAAPDATTGQIIGDGVKTMLADRIDAAVHNHSHFLGAETPNLLRMKCHSDFYEKLKATVLKTDAVAAQAVSADSSVAVIPQSECLREVTVFESFCNVNCVAAYANIFIPTFSNTSVISVPIIASTTKSSSTFPPKSYDVTRNYRRAISHHSKKFAEMSTPSTSKVHYWDADIEVVSDMETYSSAAACFPEGKRIKRKRVGDLESSSDEALPPKITTRKSAKLEVNAHSSSNETISDDIEETSNLRRHCISPSLVGGKHHFPLQSAQSTRERYLKAHSKASKVVTIELSSDEDVVDEEEPLPIEESQLASESRKLIKSMESSISKPRGRTAHPIKPVGTPVSSLDKDAIQRAQAIIEAWRSSSYEVVPDEAELSSIQRKTIPLRSRRSLYSSTDPLAISTDDAEESEKTQMKVPRSKAQRRTRTPKETNKRGPNVETIVRSSSPHQGNDVFLSPKSSRNRVTGNDGTVLPQSASAHEKGEMRQQTRNSEPSAQLVSSETQGVSQVHKPRIRKAKKVEESVKELDASRSQRSSGKISHLETDHIHVSKSHTPPPDQVVQNAETLSSQREPSTTSLPSSEAQVISRTHGSRRGRPRKGGQPVETKGLDSAPPPESDPPYSSEAPTSSPERAFQKPSEAHEVRGQMTATRSLSPMETQDHPQTRKPRGRKPKKLAESLETKVLDSGRSLRSGNNMLQEKVDRILTPKSPTASPERPLQKSSTALSGKHGTPSSSQPLKTQDGTQKRRAVESNSPGKPLPEDKTPKNSKHRERSKSSQATSCDNVKPNSSLGSEPRSQNVERKMATQLRDTNDVTCSSSGPERGSGSLTRETKRISFEDQIFPERFKHSGASKVSTKRAPAGKDDESKATRTLRSSSQSSGGEGGTEPETSARGRPRYRAGKESVHVPSESISFNQRTRSEEKGRLHPKKTVETHLSGDDYVGESRRKSLRQKGQ
ncbi:hypothetical protein OSTOST_02328 [Ostertagia ostertagi]